MNVADKGKNEDKRRIIHLEKIISRQKHRLCQLEAIVQEIRMLLNSKQQEAHFDMCEIINNLDDDLTMDRENGEFGYKNDRLAILAVKKYTMKLLNKKSRKWKRMALNGN